MDRAFKEIIKASYNAQASLYEFRSSMQRNNLKKLIDYLLAMNLEACKGILLDVGCGNGVIVDEFMRRKLNFDVMKLYGIDISQQMISAANRKHSDIGCFSVGDAEALAFHDSFFDTVFSNSVLHWLHVPERKHTPHKALSEIYRVLKPAGYTALSISASGTAKNFQASYHAICQSLPNNYYNSKSFYRDDPIGSLSLFDLVDMLQDIGYDIHMACTDYEPVYYEDAAEYANDVKAYGLDMYLAPFKKDYWDDIWLRVVQRFSEAMGSSEYIHDQYMNYLICKKPT